MATYVLYYRQPTAVVHNSTPYSLTPTRQDHTVKLQSRKSAVPTISSLGAYGRAGANADGKCEPVSSRRSNNTAVPGEMNEQEESVFFRLPAELRNAVYKELLYPNTTSLKQLAKQKTDVSTRNFNQVSTKGELYPQILSTCKRIALEASPLLYTTHVFHAHPSLLTSLPHLTSPSRPILYNHLTSQIRRWHISLRLDTDPRITSEQAAKAFSGAEYLEIRVWQAQFGACDFGALKLFKDVRGVKVARVGGSVEENLARWLEEEMMKPAAEKRKCGCQAECEADVEQSCPTFKGRDEVLCGRCYKKADCAC